MSTGSKSKILIFIIAVLLIANIAMLVVYKKSEDEKKAIVDKNRFGLTPFLKDQMKFSEPQMKDFEQLKTKQKEALRPFFDSLKSAKTDLYTLLDKPLYQTQLFHFSLQILGSTRAKLIANFLSIFKM